MASFVLLEILSWLKYKIYAFTLKRREKKRHWKVKGVGIQNQMHSHDPRCTWDGKYNYMSSQVAWEIQAACARVWDWVELRHIVLPVVPSVQQTSVYKGFVLPSTAIFPFFFRLLDLTWLLLQIRVYARQIFLNSSSSWALSVPPALFG